MSPNLFVPQYFPFKMKESDNFTSKSLLRVKLYDLRKQEGFLFACSVCKISMLYFPTLMDHTYSYGI